MLTFLSFLICDRSILSVKHYYFVIYSIYNLIDVLDLNLQFALFGIF